MEARAVITNFGSTVDALAESARRMVEVQGKFRALPNGAPAIHALERARSAAVATMEYKLRDWLGSERHSPYLDPRAADGLLALLPECLQTEATACRPAAE